MASPGGAPAAVVPATAIFDDHHHLHHLPSSAWQNFTSWTVQHLKHSVNVTRYAPTLEDLILAGPRMLTRLGSIISFPDAVDGFGQRVIPDATGGSDGSDSDYFLAATTTTTMTTEIAADASTVAAMAANLLDDDQDPSAIVSRFSMEGTKGLGSVFSYATSKWALCCVAMVCAQSRRLLA